MTSNRRKELIYGMQSWYLQEFFDNGIDNSVSEMIAESGINTILIGTHKDYLRRGKLPHNKKRKFHEIEGFLYNFDPSKYKKIKIKPEKTHSPELKDIDSFRIVVEKCKKMGLKVYALVVNRFPFLNGKYPDLNMVAVNGMPIPQVLCLNQPDVREFYFAMIDDLMDNYDIDGFFWALLDHYAQWGFQHLTDELAESLRIKRFSTPEMGLCCFCDVCISRARVTGIDVEKVKRGLLNGVKLGWIPHKVERMLTSGEVFSFLIEVPEFLEWLRFRASLFTELHQQLCDKIKSNNPECKCALDIYGFSDAWKYQSNFRDLAKISDWIKPMFYSGTYPGIPLTPERIGEETKRNVEEVEGTTLIVPGISGLSSESAEKVTSSTTKAVESGADGIILSWDYSLIPYSNMRAVKNTLKNLQKI